jgi:hypothetical protein
MSIFSAELTAIKIAVEIAVKTLSTENKITIFSDSLSGLTSLRSPALKNSPNLVKEIYHLISTNKLKISLMWVPSHIGVVGNEHADRLAAMGTAHPTIDIEMMQDLKELKPKIKSHIDQLWQQKWDSLNKGDLYHRISPRIHPEKWRWKTRKAQVVAFKLRLNACNLNSGLFIIGHHNTGNCDICNEKETVDHLLIECQSALTQEIKDKCQQLQIEHTVENVLSNQTILYLIAEKLQRKI